MTESVKNSSTSFDKNMPSTNDTKSFTKFSIKFITADMSFVTAKGDISTVTADINKDSNRDATNGNTLGALTAITSTACIGNGESGDSVTSGTSPTNKLEHIEQCSGFSIESIMKEGKESFASELKHKEVSPKIEVRSVEPKSDDREKIETKKTLVYKSTRVSSDNVLTIPESDTNDYTFCDKSSEVKHPQTPLNNVPNQSHSPQLPETAFAYPVQEESISELMSVDGYSVSLPHTTSHKNLSGIDNKTHSAEKKTAHRICARIEHHVNRKSETKVKHVKNNISEPNFVKTKKKKPVIILNKNRAENHITVLNIPNITSKGPPMKRQKLSKLDVAILRRKEKKLRRQKLKKDNQRECDIFVDEDKEDSDCSGSDGDEEIEIDLCIKSGPACKLNLDSKKMKFLEVFRLTTHLRQNSIEMQKLVRRKWVMPDVIQEEESTEIPILNLPISKKSLLVMSRMQNPQQKNFLQVLGLETVAADRKEEMEEIWERVVEERLRRKCESSLTKYYQKVFKAIAAEKEVQNISNCINQKTFLALPIVQQYKNQHLVTQNRDNTPFVLRKCPIQKLRSNGQKYNSVRTGNIPYGLPSEENRNLGVLLKLPKSYKLSHCRTEDDCGSVSVISPDDKPISIHPKASTLQDLSRLKNKHFIKDKSENDKLENLPLKMIIVDTQCQNDRISMSESNPLKEDSDAAVKPKFSWPGLMEIKQAYERYSQERFREMVDFKKQHCILANETLKKQAEVKFLERKQRNLHTTLFRAEREKKELLRTIDQLTNFIKKIR